MHGPRHCQTEQDKYHIISLTGGVLKKRVQMILFTKQKHSHRGGTQTYVYLGVRREDKLGD